MFRIREFIGYGKQTSMKLIGIVNRTADEMHASMARARHKRDRLKHKK